MDTNSLIKTDIQRLNIDSELVDLWSFNTTNYGGTIYYFTPMVDDNHDIVKFNGIEYIPLPVQITGIEMTGDGRLPRPRLTLGNVSAAFIGIINQYQDGVGCKVTRIRTFKKYIDDHSESNTAARFPSDIYYVEQKTMQNRTSVEWELVTPMDIGDMKLPRNQGISYCQHRYRIYKDGSFINGTCPYVGSSYFKKDGSITTITLDSCGKKLTDCELRYPGNVQLPFKGFPDIGTLGRAYR